VRSWVLLSTVFVLASLLIENLRLPNSNPEGSVGPANSVFGLAISMGGLV
jgi:hypothetical protein